MRARISSQRFISGNKRAIPVHFTILVDFPQFFPQVWKTLARDQTAHGINTAGASQRRTPTLTYSRLIDTLGTGSLTLRVRLYIEGMSWLREFGLFNPTTVTARRRMGSSFA